LVGCVMEGVRTLDRGKGASRSMLVDLVHSLGVRLMMCEFRFDMRGQKYHLCLRGEDADEPFMTDSSYLVSSMSIRYF